MVEKKGEGQLARVRKGDKDGTTLIITLPKILCEAKGIKAEDLVLLWVDKYSSQI